MIQRLIIISGSSRGLGFALAQQLASAHTLLVGISRSHNSELAAFCRQSGATYQHINADLSHASGVELAATALKQTLIEHPGLAHYWLINNASTVSPMAQSHQMQDPHAIAQALQLNIGSVISLTATFLAHTSAVADRRVLNISSGAGHKPVPGWSVYGASKAAVNHYTQILAVEQPSVLTVALAPGVMDTDMQTAIRDADATKFPNLDRFIQLHQNQQLSSASSTAEHIAHYLAHNDFGTKTIDDIRHYF